MYSDIPKLDRDYTQIPNELYRITESTQEDCLLIHLIRLQGKNKSCYVSIKTLGRYLHTSHLQTVEKYIKLLLSKGYISYIKGNPEKNLSNEYSVNMDKILRDIRLKQSNKDIGEKASKEYSDQQKDMMALRRISQNQKLLLKANSTNGIKAVDNISGEILN